MVFTSWSTRLLPPQISAPFLATLDRAFQATGLTRGPAAWFGARTRPDFVMGQNVFERAEKQGDDRVTVSFAPAGGFDTTTAYLARLGLESGASTVARLQIWAPTLDFNLLGGGTPAPSAVIERLGDAVAVAFSEAGQSPLVECELLGTQLTSDQVLAWADEHIQRANLTAPRLEALRLIPGGHRSDVAGQTPGAYWVARYASQGAENNRMTVVNIEDRTGEVKIG